MRANRGPRCRFGHGYVDIVLGRAPIQLESCYLRAKSMKDIIVEGPESSKVPAGMYELANMSQWRLQRLTKAPSELDDQLDSVLLIDTGAGISRNVPRFSLLRVQER